MKKINNLISVLMIAADLIYLIIFIMNKDLVRILMALLLPLLMFLPLIVKKRIKVNEYLRFIYYVYIFLLLFLGCIVNLYAKIYFYDSLAHFLFGIASSIFALYVLKQFKKYDIKKKTFNISYIIIMTLALSAFWEILEFINSKIFLLDVQHVLTTGVNDTMKDIILALLGSLLFSIFYLYKIKENDKFIDKIIE